MSQEIITAMQSCHSALEAMKGGERLTYTNENWQIVKSDDPLGQGTLLKTMVAFSNLVVLIDDTLQSGQITQAEHSASSELVTRLRDWSTQTIQQFEKKNSSWWRRFLSWLPFSPLAKYQQEVRENEERLQALLKFTEMQLEKTIPIDVIPEKLNKVLEELMQTESSYNQTLKTMLQVCIKLQNNREELIAQVSAESQEACRKAIKEMQHLSEVVVGLSQISDDFLNKFHSASKPEEIAGVFQENKKSLDYFKKAASIVKKYQKIAAKGGEEFKKIIQDLLLQESHHPLFESLLITPVQRLPRYQLLLTECLKASPSPNLIVAFEDALAGIILATHKVNKSL